jgi:hypothetical protein
MVETGVEPVYRIAPDDEIWNYKEGAEGHYIDNNVQDKG